MIEDTERLAQALEQSYQTISTRRGLFAGIGAFAGGAAAIACSGGEKTLTPEDVARQNEPFRQNLLQLAEITPTTTRTDLALRQRQRAVSDWLKGTEVGSFVNRMGKQVPFRLGSDGSPALSVNTKYDYFPPSPSHFTTTIGDDFGGTTMVYGNYEAAQRIAAQGPLIADFTQELFAGSQAQQNRMHINLCPSNYLLTFTGLTPEESNKIAAQAVTGGVIGKRAAGSFGGPTSYDIIINIPFVHNMGETVGIAPRTMLTETLARYATLAFSYQQGDFPGEIANKSYASIIGKLASMDSSVAQIALGGNNFQEFTQVMEQNMERLGKKVR